MKNPAVYLIGTGPGDPGLITVHGLDCLQKADVVVYDPLVSTRLLKHARPGAELINVGSSAQKPMAQEAISYLLAEKAREGSLAARLLTSTGPVSPGSKGRWSAMPARSSCRACSKRCARAAGTATGRR